MDYIIQNWSKLNFMDRTWFVIGLWLLSLFIGVFISRIIRFLKNKDKNSSHKKSPSQS